MSNLIEEGKYLAKIIDFGFTKTSKDKLQVAVKFGIEDEEGAKRTIVWFGSLNQGKAREITIKQLLRCGLKGNDIRILSKGLEGKGLDVETEVEVEIIQIEDQKGNLRNKVQWINSLGMKKIDASEINNQLGDGLSGDILSLRQSTGMIEKAVKEEMSIDDIPF
ncbi:MAG: hypothetical protein ACO2ZP_07310 [Bacteriovoracaceae bacterium]